MQTKKLRMRAVIILWTFQKNQVFPVLYGEALQSCEQATSELATRENLCLRKFSNLSSAKVYI